MWFTDEQIAVAQTMLKVLVLLAAVGVLSVIGWLVYAVIVLMF